MKRTIVAIAIAMAAGLSGCDTSGGAGQPDAPASRSVGSVAEPAADGPAIVPATPGQPPVPGAPAFAALYPDAVLEAPATIADGEAGPGGLVTFVTQATPPDVIDFYRTRAEASGLSSVTAMNQGEAQAYGAASAEGASVQVVASPSEDGATSVQLSWSAGQ